MIQYLKDLTYDGLEEQVKTIIVKKLPSGNYQAQIRLKGLKPITKSFKTKKNATAFVREVEGNAELALALGNPINQNITLSNLIRYSFNNPYQDSSCIITTAR